MLCARYKQLFSRYYLSNEYRISNIITRQCSKTLIAPVMKSERSKSEEEVTTTRINPVGVQMLSESLHKQIFGQAKEENCIEYQNRINRTVNHLKRHELWGKPTELLPDISFKIPELQGRNIDEHFRTIANEQIKKYRELLDKLIENDLPPLPKQWNFQTGWTKYSSTSEIEIVDFPEDEALVFDVEVCVPESKLPVLATAASPNAWYSWCSPRLTELKFPESKKNRTDDLIPLETKYGQVFPPNGNWKERIIVGHNVSFDRALLKEQYYLKGSNTRFVDTMSLHIAVSGMTTFQRSLKAANKTNSNRKDIQEAKSKLSGPIVVDWLEMTSANGLADVHQLYCDGERLDKETRDIFVTGSINDIRADFQNLMTYCSKDVSATHAVLQSVLPLYYERFPHPATLAGMLEMSVAYLPVNENWDKYLSNSQSMYDNLQKEVKLTLMHLAEEACRLLNEEKYKNDFWLWDLDWTVKKLKRKKKKLKKGANETIKDEKTCSGSNETAENILPEWYRKLCSKKEETETNWPKGKPLISTQMRIAPQLLRLTWDGYPLHYDDTHGWGYLVPKKSTEMSSKLESSDNTILENSVNLDMLWDQLEKGIGDPTELSELFQYAMKTQAEKEKKLKYTNKSETNSSTKILKEINGCDFYRLPHKDGPKNRVGNPLAKDFLSKIEDGTMKAESGVKADYILKIGKMTSYWKNAHKRIASQLVVWLKENELTTTVTQSNEYQKEKSFGAILPQIVTAGTLTRRAVEKTWLTASNAYIDRVGSELKSMIQAPPGYKFVGADVDSQELWIATILGDSNFAAIHGCTACGWMLLQGKKSNGTDLHSRTAQTVGISRDHAKVMTYGRIYGAGQPFAQQLLKQFNNRLSLEEAKVKARTMFAATKGVRGYLLNETGLELYKLWKEDTGHAASYDTCLTRGEILKMLMDTNCSLRFHEVISQSAWLGGTESAMFNQLEAIAHSKEPCTPVLGCRISRSLEPGVVGQNFMTSRVNWVVQSSAVDYLHLMLVNMRWLCSLFRIDSRFSISIHDEVRYLVKEEDRYRASLALQISNLLTRAMFSYKLGMHDLPQSVAFFSAVDIDTVLRKEVTMDCKTPSNPKGLTEGYGIGAGEAFDIYEIVEKTNGSLDSNHNNNKT